MTGTTTRSQRRWLIFTVSHSPRARRFRNSIGAIGGSSSMDRRRSRLVALFRRHSSRTLDTSAASEFLSSIGATHCSFALCVPWRQGRVVTAGAASYRTRPTISRLRTTSSRPATAFTDRKLRGDGLTLYTGGNRFNRTNSCRAARVPQQTAAQRGRPDGIKSARCQRRHSPGGFVPPGFFCVLEGFAMRIRNRRPSGYA